jgi:hypothetical protein
MRVSLRALTSIERVQAAAFAAACGGVLAVSFLLTPDPRGFGTHEQLGLPPCASRFLFHTPCQLCGMTTSFTYMAHGMPLRALLAQPAGALAFFFCAFGGLAGAVCATTGVAPTLLSHPRFRYWALRVAFAVLFVAWVYKVVAITLSGR